MAAPTAALHMSESTEARKAIPQFFFLYSTSLEHLLVYGRAKVISQYVSMNKYVQDWAPVEYLFSLYSP
jgi:hypothetical protein